MRKGFLLPIITLVLFASCSDQMPYLNVWISGTYAVGDPVEIHYDFRSESDSQRCRVRLYETTAPDYLLLDNEDRELPDHGTLSSPPLNAGSYMVEFMLLSERNGELHELWFLSNNQGFSVP